VGTSATTSENIVVSQKSKQVTKIKIICNFLIEFFMACMLISLEFLHKNCILHRDIKPENLVFDESGYLRITDLGIARVWNPENAKDTSGTPGYMAPEVMCR
jgi:serine/threonine protein kinase